jgi:hypothetical protein
MDANPAVAALKAHGLTTAEAIANIEESKRSGVLKALADWHRDQLGHIGGPNVEHRDGLPWWDAPKPRRWHKCAAQTSGTVNNFEQVDRCACGAIRRNGGRWFERNSR